MLFVCFMFGWLAWTLAEYGIHRFVLHHGPFMAEHMRHHNDPTADDVGVPFRYSFAIAAGLAVLAWMLAGLAGVATVAGLFIGYLAYVTLHESLHRLRITPGHWLYASKMRHELHHAGRPVNYGVTFPLWDIAFGTYAKV